MEKRWEWFKQMVGYLIACAFLLSIALFAFEMFITSMSMVAPNEPHYFAIIPTFLLLISGTFAMMALKRGLFYQASMLVVSVVFLIISWNWQLEYFNYAVDKGYLSSCYPLILSIIACVAWLVRCIKVLKPGLA